MTSTARRGVAVALAVVVATASGVVTNLATDQPSWSLWTALIVLVALGTSIQLYLTYSPSPGSHTEVAAVGPGAVAIGGSSQGEITTRAAGTASSPPQSNAAVAAHGPGSVAIGGDNESSVQTNARRAEF